MVSLSIVPEILAYCIAVFLGSQGLCLQGRVLERMLPFFDLSTH